MKNRSQFTFQQKNTAFHCNSGLSQYQVTLKMGHGHKNWQEQVKPKLWLLSCTAWNESSCLNLNSVQKDFENKKSSYFNLLCVFIFFWTLEWQSPLLQTFLQSKHTFYQFISETVTMALIVLQVNCRGCGLLTFPEHSYLHTT